MVTDAGFETFLPHRDNPPKVKVNVKEIFENEKRGGIDTFDVVVANLNGLITHDVTAWELGYAYASGKYLIGLHTDWRARFQHEVIYLMTKASLNELVRTNNWPKCPILGCDTPSAWVGGDLVLTFNHKCG